MSDQYTSELFETYKKNVMVSPLTAPVTLLGVNVRVSFKPTITLWSCCASAAPAKARVARMVEKCILDGCAKLESSHAERARECATSFKEVLSVDKK